MQLYVVGLKRFMLHDWELQGVFDKYELALSACKNHNYFIAPIILNKEFPEETTKWEGLHYPIEFKPCEL